MFRLPDFLRSAWTSDLARDTWKPRFDAIQEAWPRIILNAAAESSLGCTIRSLPPWMIFRLQADARKLNASVVVLGTRGLATPGYIATESGGLNGRPFQYDVALGSEAACATVEQLWEEQHYAAANLAAGTPECCVSALENNRALQRCDPIWRYLGTEQTFDADSACMADPLWAWLNIGAISFAPCTMGCAAARRKREELIGLARQVGFSREMDWLEEALAWPVEWTALHGIAELKTPVVKATWATDVAHRKATLRFQGSAYPKEGATGLDFPFRSPSRPLLTSSQAFQRGIANLIQIRC